MYSRLLYAGSIHGACTPLLLCVRMCVCVCVCVCVIEREREREFVCACA